MSGDEPVGAGTERLKLGIAAFWYVGKKGIIAGAEARQEFLPGKAPDGGIGAGGKKRKG